MLFGLSWATSVSHLYQYVKVYEIFTCQNAHTHTMVKLQGIL